jgi:surfeit locus 1 family protein
LYLFLLSPRWIVLHLIVALLATLFLNLGFWQLRRHERVVARNNLVASRLIAAPEPFKAIASRYDIGALPGNPEAAAYRRAIVNGHFDPENEVLLRSRSLDGEPGWHVLTPLLMPSGRALLVDRGWVPYELDASILKRAAPPKGEVEIVGALTPAKLPRGRFSARDPAEGRLEAVFWVDPVRIEKQLVYNLEPLYLEMATQAPPQEMLPLVPDQQELTSGPHLGYAIQWFAFSMIGLVGYVVLIRKGRQLKGRRRSGY